MARHSNTLPGEVVTDRDPIIRDATHEVAQEETALSLLKHHDLPTAEVEKIARNRNLCKNRKVAVALAQHPRLPHRLATPLLRGLYTFDLMKVALSPVTLRPEVKVLAEDLLVSRLESLTLGERRALARRAAGGILSELARQTDAGVVRALLDNPRLTEGVILKALRRKKVSEELVLAIRRHAKWSLRKEIRETLLALNESKEEAAPQSEESIQP